MPQQAHCPPTVVVVESDNLLAEFLAGCLQATGFHVVRAKTVPAARRLLNDSLAAVLIDCSPFVPDVAEIVEQAERLGLKVILMATSADHLCGSLRQRPILIKPFRIATLLAQLTGDWDKRRAERVYREMRSDSLIPAG